MRIVATPPGEAPLEVREAWLGLRLPLARLNSRPREWRTSGVLSGPRGLGERLRALLQGGFQRQRGYAVPAHEAVSVLEQTRPEAARWWREHASHAVRPGRFFVFAEEVCVEESD